MTKKSDDQRGMSNEILPAPERADVKVSPRDRTAQHLSKVLAAAAGLALAPLAAADVTPPPGGSDKKPPEGDKSKANPPKGGDKKPEQRPEPPGYGVVDPIPRPPDDAGKPGFLKLDSKPTGASINVDGRNLGLKTPQKKLKLPPGLHTLTLTSSDGKITQNFSVEIEEGKTASLTLELAPPKASPSK